MNTLKKICLHNERGIYIVFEKKISIDLSCFLTAWDVASKEKKIWCRWRYGRSRVSTLEAQWTPCNRASSELSPKRFLFFSVGWLPPWHSRPRCASSASLFCNVADQLFSSSAKILWEDDLATSSPSSLATLARTQGTYVTIVTKP